MADRQIADVLTDDLLRTVTVPSMTREAYSRIKRMNASSLKAGLLGSSDIDPVLIRNAYEGTRAAPTASLQDSFDRGTLAHTILLEPEKLVDCVAVWGGDRRAGSEWKEFNEANAGKLIMRAADVREVQAACREVRGIQPVNDLLRRKRETELAVFGKVSKTYCKGLIDSITSDDGPVTMIDLKTTSRAIDEESITREVRRLHYREQLGLYANLYEQATGKQVEKVFLLFVSLETSGVRLVRLTTSALQFGLARMTAAIEAVERCIEKNEWLTFYAESICDVSEFEIGNINLEGFDE